MSLRSAGFRKRHLVSDGRETFSSAYSTGTVHSELQGRPIAFGQVCSNGVNFQFSFSEVWVDSRKKQSQVHFVSFFQLDTCLAMRPLSDKVTAKSVTASSSIWTTLVPIPQKRPSCGSIRMDTNLLLSRNGAAFRVSRPGGLLCPWTPQKSARQKKLRQ